MFFRAPCDQDFETPYMLVLCLHLPYASVVSHRHGSGPILTRHCESSAHGPPDRASTCPTRRYYTGMDRSHIMRDAVVAAPVGLLLIMYPPARTCFHPEFRNPPWKSVPNPGIQKDIESRVFDVCLHPPYSSVQPNRHGRVPYIETLL